MKDDTLPTSFPSTRVQTKSKASLQPFSANYVLAETLFQALLESAPDAMVIADAKGQILIANSQVENLFGYHRGALIGQPIEMLMPDYIREAHVRHRMNYFENPHARPMGSGLDLIAQRKDGSTFPVEISLSALPIDSVMLVTAAIRDVTDRKRVAELLEQQVEQRTAHLNALLQFSRELLGVRGLDAVLHRALMHAFALAPEATSGAIYLYEPDDDTLALRASVGFNRLPSLRRPISLGAIGMAFTTGQPQYADSAEALVALVPESSETYLRRLWEALGLEALPNGLIALPLIAHHTVIGVLFLLRTHGPGPFAGDGRATLEGLAHLTAAAIQEDRRAHEAMALSNRLIHLEEQQRAMVARLTTAEAAMLQAARLAAVGQLAASVAHEINNPLYAVRNAICLLEEDLPEDMRESPYVTIVREQLARIAGIIERMRDFYRPNRGELTPCNLNALLEETLEIAGLNMRYASINTIFAPDATLSEVVCDGDQLRQVFLNLILNAIDAMPQGGTLTVRTAAGPTVAVIEVQDSGIGIPESVRARLFEPFFTNKPNGTGLGLSISAHIVTQHGGQIEVDSVENTGSTFRVILPYQM